MSARGAIVAAVNDLGEPYVAIVVSCREGLGGEDVWRIRDGLGDETEVRASDVPVIDDDRVAELRAVLDQ